MDGDEEREETAPELNWACESWFELREDVLEDDKDCCCKCWA